MHYSMLAGKPEFTFRVLMQIQSFATSLPVISSIKSNLSESQVEQKHILQGTVWIAELR